MKQNPAFDPQAVARNVTYAPGRRREYDLEPQDISTATHCPYYLKDYQHSVALRNYRNTIQGEKIALQMLIKYVRSNETDRLSGEVRKRVLSRYMRRLNDIDVILRVINLCQ